QTVIDEAAVKADPTLAPLKGHSPLTAWRDLVLAPHKDFRRDQHTQELTAEKQLAYMRLHNDVVGRQTKTKLAEAAPLVPLLPPLSHDAARHPVFPGPFDGARDDEGVEYVPEHAMQKVLDQMGLPSRRRAPVQQLPPPGRPDAMPKGS
ncbi:MAG: hypothetical protein K2W96_26510, partial [Gemmataceae bacterium]|nr:hypothetical protein [Gemmataceae bacterium]